MILKTMTYILYIIYIKYMSFYYMNYVTAGQIIKEYKISYPTLKRWKDDNKIKYKQLSSKKILYDIDSVNNSDITDTRLNVIYARVSTSNQKHDLNNQIEVIKQYMLSHGIITDDIYTDIASGLNENRIGLNKLIYDVENNKIKSIYITFKDRLSRFGFDYLKNIFAQHNVEIIVLDNLEMTNNLFEKEIEEDLISIIHHYSTKLSSLKRKKLKEFEKILSNID